MLEAPVRRAVAELAVAVLSVQPLAEALDRPVRVESLVGRWAVLDRITDRLGLARFVPAAEPDLTALERVVSARLTAPGVTSAAGSDLGAVDRVVAQVMVDDFTSFAGRVMVQSGDGVWFPAYTAGDPAAPAVVIASACGMPARLAESWIRRLAERFHVITWESRGLFPAATWFAAATDVAAQVGDLLAVLDHLGVAAAHIMGLCGGAALAVVAAHDNPDRVKSMSLWHGDFELGAGVPKTDHQRDLLGMMQAAARCPDSAAAVHSVLCRSMLSGTPPDQAHLVLYPYATPELLLRYCRLNGAIMSTDIGPLLAEVWQPTLVVTSASDHTAHPEGSRYVAAGLPASRLVVTERGDHLSLFREVPQLALAAQFIAEPASPWSGEPPAAQS